MSAMALFDALVNYEGNREVIEELVQAMECEDITWHISNIIGRDDSVFYGHEVMVADDVSDDMLFVSTSMNVARYYEVKGDVEYCGVIIYGAGDVLVDAILKYIRHEGVEE